MFGSWPDTSDSDEARYKFNKLNRVWTSVWGRYTEERRTEVWE